MNLALGDDLEARAAGRGGAAETQTWTSATGAGSALEAGGAGTSQGAGPGTCGPALRECTAPACHQGAPEIMGKLVVLTLLGAVLALIGERLVAFR